MVIKVHTRYYALLREHTKKQEESLELPSGSTPMGLITAVLERYGEGLRRYLLDEAGRLRSSITVAVNGEKVPRERLEEMQLKEGDEVVIIPPISGGSYLSPEPPEAL